VFEVSGKLFGLKFTKSDEIPVYHPDVEAYEVTDLKGNHVAVYLWIIFLEQANVVVLG
jgi:peptidyl-dipeptidase Dcp